VGEIWMGCVVVAAALAVGACGSGGEAGGTASPTATTAPPGVKATPTVPVVDDAGDPSMVTCVAASGGTAVAIEGFTFVPRQVEVPAGGSVTFTNLDATDHSVWSAARRDGQPAWLSVGSDPTFRLPEVLHEGDASTCTFAAPGTYRYLCGVHNAMTGSITVS
jgi:plastocyanin